MGLVIINCLSVSLSENVFISSIFLKGLFIRLGLFKNTVILPFGLSVSDEKYIVLYCHHGFPVCNVLFFSGYF